ncbi:MAG: hypothetical protein KDB20_02375 [Microthrixaceae bacterium]|nr:hypothetical protein [Microthrixaceae bacterium]
MSGEQVALDRRAASPRRTLAIGALSALSVGLAVSLLPARVGGVAMAFGSGATVALLGVFGLRSVPLRRVVRGLCLLGVVIVVGWADLASSQVDTTMVGLAWMAATAAALVAAQTTWGAAPGRPPQWSAPAVATATVGLVVAMATSAIVFSPTVTGAFGDGVRSGASANPWDRQSSNPMAATSQLDMTRRPRLSDDLIMTVRSDAPGFWRAQVFDVWDGRTWTISDAQLAPIGADGSVNSTDRDDLATATLHQPTEVVEQFRIEARFSSSMPLSPVPLRVNADENINMVSLPDGSIVVPAGLGKGATYEVTSARQLDLTAEVLRSTNEVEANARIADRYAQQAVATERVRRLAVELAAGADTTFDKVQAIEAWLDRNVTYSIDAPLAPTDTDVVDDFLFESRVGWCEQIASSMTVLLREQGVPARLATGFVPDSRDAVSGRYRVLENGAHAWTEMWFEGVGWVPFDPTAGIEVSGRASLGESSTGAVRTAAMIVGLVVVLWVVLWPPVMGLVRRRGRGVRLFEAALSALDRRRRTRRLARSGEVADRVVIRLEEVARRHGLERSRDESGARFARRVGATLDVEGLDEVAAALDLRLYGPDGERDKAVPQLESALTHLFSDNQWS